MADIQVLIHRPVALPPKFLGAPELPAHTAFGACALLMFVPLMTPYPLWGMLAIFVWPFLHSAAIYLGYKEPHLSTIMQTFHLSSRAPRNIGVAFKNRRVFKAG